MTDPREDSVREVLAHYEAGVKGALLVEYRCRQRRCPLLHVWQTPNGPEFFAPGCRVSDRWASAPQLDWLALDRTPDRTGDRAGRLNDPVITSHWLLLMCQHVMELIWVRDIRRDFASRTPGRPALVVLPRDTRGHSGAHTAIDDIQ
jgi:hypothetical protein